MSENTTQDHNYYHEHHAGISKLRDMVRDIDFAMLTTVDDDGTLHSRPMALNSEIEFDGDLWFFTHASAHKVEEVQREQQVNAAFSNPKQQNYVSMSGTATVVRDRAKIKELWKPQLKAWFLGGEEDTDIALLKVTVTKAEYWDTPASPVAHLFGMIQSTLTGQQPNIGEHEKVNL